jgi:hypothetical protein
MVIRRYTRGGALTLAALALAVSMLSSAARTEACPFCDKPSLTMTEQLASSDAAVLVAWASGEKGTETKPGTTTYKVQQILKGPKSLMKDSKITVDRYRAAKVGDLFMVLGTKGDGIEWGSPIEVTETTFNYVSQAPSPESPVAKRLEYFAKYLEYPDSTIATDAFSEFANAQYKDVVAVAKDLPHEKLRKWIADPETAQTRLGLYGMMLGLCGDEDDAKLLEKKMLDANGDFRLGIDGVMYGYLLITGDKGLAVIDREKIEKKKKVPFSETFAAMTALRNMWTYGNGRIEPERLRQSMRLLLDRPELADLVIPDLARWKDWTVQDRLMEMYDSEEFNIPAVKRAIVRYLLVCSRDVSTGPDGTVNPYAADAKQLLEGLRKKDPKTVSEAERFFVLP